MAATTVFTLPSTALAVGTRTFTTSNFAAITDNWTLTFNFLVWPASGSVLDIAIFDSFDNGATFNFRTGSNYSAPQLDRNGLPQTSAAWTTNGVPGTTTLRIQVTVNQACTISASAVAT